MQRGFSSLIIILGVLLTLGVIAGGGYYFYNQQKLIKLSLSETNSITDFETCSKYYEVLLSYPGQCNTPDGRHFVQEISEEEKKKLIPPGEIQPLSNKLVAQDDINSPSIMQDILDQDTKDWITYSNTKQNYSIKYPPNWIIISDTFFDGNTIGGIKSSDNSNATTLGIEIHEGDLNLDRYAYFYHLNPKIEPKLIETKVLNNQIWNKYSNIEDFSENNPLYVMGTTYKGEKYFLIKKVQKGKEDSRKIELMIKTFKFLE